MAQPIDNKLDYLSKHIKDIYKDQKLKNYNHTTKINKSVCKNIESLDKVLKIKIFHDLTKIDNHENLDVILKKAYRFYHDKHNTTNATNNKEKEYSELIIHINKNIDDINEKINNEKIKEYIDELKNELIEKQKTLAIFTENYNKIKNSICDNNTNIVNYKSIALDALKILEKNNNNSYYLYNKTKNYVLCNKIEISTGNGYTNIKIYDTIKINTNNNYHNNHNNNSHTYRNNHNYRNNNTDNYDNNNKRNDYQNKNNKKINYNVEYPSFNDINNNNTKKNENETTTFVPKYKKNSSNVFDVLSEENIQPVIQQKNSFIKKVETIWNKPLDKIKESNTNIIKLTTPLKKPIKKTNVIFYNSDNEDDDYNEDNYDDDYNEDNYNNDYYNYSNLNYDNNIVLSDDEL
jgi:hypothetical protein